MADEPSADEKFKRWFAEQDPFGNLKEKRRTEPAKTVQARPPAADEKGATPDEPSGDAAFKRWFAEQDPFGNSKSKRQAEQTQSEQAKTEQKRARPSGLFGSRMGILLGAILLAILGLSIFLIFALRALRLH